jgi:hypothetical protein
MHQILILTWAPQLSSILVKSGINERSATMTGSWMERRVEQMNKRQDMFAYDGR